MTPRVEDGIKLSDLISERDSRRGFQRHFSCSLGKMRFLHRPGAPAGDGEAMTMVYLLEGQGEFRNQEGEIRELVAGDVCLLAGGRRGALGFSGEQALQAVLNAPGEILSLAERIGVARPSRELFHIGASAELAARFSELSESLRQDQGGEPDRNVGGFFELVSDVFRRARANRTLLESGLALSEACRDLARDLHERMSIPELAARFQMSYSAFRREFARLMDMPPGEYRIRQRIESIKIHIAQYETPIKEVAARFGYPDLQSFSKQFKKMTGLTPRQFQAEVLS